MGYGDPTLYSTKRPKKNPGGKKKIIRSAHNRSTAAVTTHTRRLSNGRVVLVRAHKRSPTSVKQHEKSGKGYGIRERRISGKIDYKRHAKQNKQVASNRNSKAWSR
jgi:hypothetical protein